MTGGRGQRIVMISDSNSVRIRAQMSIDEVIPPRHFIPMVQDQESDGLEFEVRLRALKIAENSVGSRIRSRRVSVRRKALLEAAALADSAEIKELARKEVLAKKARMRKA